MVFLLTDPDLASVKFDEFEWQATETGFVAEERSRRDQQICLCPGYECEVSIEPVHIAYEGWFRRYFIIVKDPTAGDHPDWGRKVWAEPVCLKKQKGELLKLSLTEFNGPDSAGVKTVKHLHLEIS